MLQRVILLLCAVIAAAHAQTGGELFQQAQQIFNQQGPGAALPEFQRALEAYRGAHDLAGEAKSLNVAGICYRRMGEYKQAIERLEASLEIKRRLGDRVEEAKTLNNIGEVYRGTSDYRRALANHRRALDLGKGTAFETSIENNIGLDLMEQGSYGEARTHLERALQIDKDNPDALENLGGSYQL